MVPSRDAPALGWDKSNSNRKQWMEREKYPTNEINGAQWLAVGRCLGRIPEWLTEGWSQQLGEWGHHWEVLSRGTRSQATVTHFSSAARYLGVRPGARSHKLQTSPRPSFQGVWSSSDMELTLQKTSRSLASSYNDNTPTSSVTDPTAPI